MLKRFIAEASRRRVFRGAAIYVIIAWAAVMAVEALTQPFDPLRRLAFLLAVGLFPLAIVFSWVFKVTPGAVEQEHTGAAPPPQTMLGRLFDWAAFLGVAAIIAFGVARLLIVRF
jgi:hypothetical protein